MHGKMHGFLRMYWAKKVCTADQRCWGRVICYQEARRKGNTAQHPRCCCMLCRTSCSLLKECAAPQSILYVLQAMQGLCCLPDDHGRATGLCPEVGTVQAWPSRAIQPPESRKTWVF